MEDNPQSKPPMDQGAPVDEPHEELAFVDRPPASAKSRRSRSGASPLNPPEQWVDRPIEQYRVRSVLGAGCSGLSLLAEASSDQERVVLKLLDPQAMQAIPESTLAKRIELASRLNPTTMIPPKRIVQHQGHCFILTDYLDAQPLAAQLAQGELGRPDLVRKMLHPILVGLVEAHSNGLVHGAIHPHNILVQRGRGWVVDWGLDELPIRPDLDPDDPIRLRRLRYAAPETLEGAAPLAASDVYSLAAVMFHCLTGRAPFTGEAQAKLQQQHRYSPPPDASHLVSDCPPALAGLIQRCLAKDPEERPTAKQFFKEFVEALEDASTRLGFDGWSDNTLPELADSTLANGSAIMSGSAVDFDGSSVLPPEPQNVRKYALIGGGVAGVAALLVLAGLVVVPMLGGGAGGPSEPLARSGPGEPAQAVPEAAAPPQDEIPNAVQLRARARALSQQLDALDPGQGLGTLVAEAKISFLEAEDLYNEGLMEQAAPKFEQFVQRAQELSRLDRRRSEAMNEREASRVVRPSAGQVERWPRSAEQFRLGQTLSTRAASHFAAGRFEQAKDEWARAGQAYQRAAELSVQLERLAKARDAFERRWERVNPQMRHLLEESFYPQIQQKLRDIRQRDHAPMELARAYERAMAGLDVALNEKQNELVELERRRAEQRAEQARRLIHQVAEQLPEPQTLSERWQRPGPTKQRLSLIVQARRSLQALKEAERLDPDHPKLEELRRIAQRLAEPPPGQPMLNSIGMRLVYIPAGQYQRGSPVTERTRDQDERPHQVKITRAFFLGANEVTFKQFKQVMGYDPLDRSTDEMDKGWQWRGNEYPVTHVNWSQAVAFCEKLSQVEGVTYRLPTEAEWEYACRAGTTTAFNTGPSLDATRANIDGYELFDPALADEIDEDHPARASRFHPMPVASFAPNDWGLFDMHGNVWEWCSDWVGNYPVGLGVDPRGPQTGGDPNTAQKVIRGGSWARPAKMARSANRLSEIRVIRRDDIGFRVVLEIPQAE
jgi:formylglycine-generating enzyme required for sulfatase activity/serine/threonine protein kinase